MTRIDHHLHTTRYSPDSIIEPAELIAKAREIGLDGVVITEHDCQWEPEELAELQAKADGLVVLSGVEVSTLDGHFLVYGLPDLSGVDPGIDLADLLEIVRVKDAAIVAAHPFRWDQDFDALLEEHGPESFDALEMASNNITLEMRTRTEKLLQVHPFGATGSSDGHEPSVIGCYYSEFPGRIRSMPEFVAALKAKTSRPRHHPNGLLTCGPLD